MASSKTTSRKATTGKTTSPKTTPPKTTTGKSAVRKTSTAKTPLPKVTSTAGVSRSTPETAKTDPVPPVALAAGQEPSPVVVKAAQPVVKMPALNKKELIEEVVLRSGIKKKDAKPVVESLLKILGETVASGRDLNLKPFGKLHLNRSEERSNGTVHICRLRQPLAINAPGQESDAAEAKSSASPLASEPS